MTQIFLQNTLGNKKEEFVPLKAGEVSMYSCGPTVYDFAHIGNFRTFILSDILRRTFEYNGYKVDGVMNVTDVDDKTIKRSRAEGISLEALTRKYEDLFFTDLETLNVKKPGKTPRATESIDDMISLIEKMLENGSAYKSSDGIYFDITKSKDYGQLAHLNLENSTKERIANDEYDKTNPRDFSLWKFYSEEDGDVSYEAPFGKGRPGWHIECSAMSMKNLSETIDIHTGGSDLIFPHHTNEIAQSEAVTGKTFVKYWVHGGFITVDGKKMSKSLGNIFTLETLIEKGFDPLAFRYLTLGTHYGGMLNFTWEALEGAQTALKKLRIKMQEFENEKTENNPAKTEEYKNQFIESLNDDLNMPQALATVWQVVKDEVLSGGDKKSLLLDFDKVLGLDLEKIESFEIPENVQNLIKERDLARNNKDFAKSDEIRAEIEKLGFEVKDTPEGTRVSPR
jgi:cysteinyl-tRNA synthetase